MDRDFLIDLFADFGPVTIRKMFSGFGISADGTNFALALRAGLYSAPMTRPFRNSKRRDRSRFSIRRGPRRHLNSYWQLPARLFDSEELADWARAALAAAQRAALRKRPKAQGGEVKVAKVAEAGVGRKRRATGASARRRAGRPQATWLRVSAAYSGSTSQITRLRPLRLAA